jgi:hypothetical protein
MAAHRSPAQDPSGARQRGGRFVCEETAEAAGPGVGVGVIGSEGPRVPARVRGKFEFEVKGGIARSNVEARFCADAALDPGITGRSPT